MIYIVAGVIILALLAILGRNPMAGKLQWRLLSGALALASLAAGVFVEARGGWIAGLVLFGAAGYLALSARRPAAAQPGAAPSPDTMSANEARAMLGIGEGAGREEIEAAYRRLMKRVHPDHGGAPGLAAKLNAARDVLLKDRK